jgi:glutamate dehydrogenase (NAD(P)+)
MAWFMDTYSQQVGYPVPEIVTGKPVVLGGTKGRDVATGLGVVFVVEDILRGRGETLEGRRVVVQGLGKVGAVVARELLARGSLIVGVSDVSGGVVHPRGLDLDAVFTWLSEHNFLRGFPDGQWVGRSEILQTPCDILVPAALEGQITEANAPDLNCALVVEAANGPTTPAADAILAERAIEVVPDVLANGGGVTVSYFEWVQDQQKYFWSAEEITARLHVKMTEALARVREGRERYGVDWRTASQAVAIQRVAEAARLRTVYP